MSEEVDKYGRPIDPAERMQQVMLGFYDLVEEASVAGFPRGLIGYLRELRNRFIDEFGRQHPGYGKGRALWR